MLGEILAEKSKSALAQNSEIACPRRVPKYCFHKATGKAVVRIEGRDHYLGSYGTPESRERYQRLIAEWNAQLAERSQENQQLAAMSKSVYNSKQLTIVEVLALYWDFAQTYYSRDGQPTKELECMKGALKPLKELYGRTLAGEFGPLCLKALRHHMIDVQNLCRNEVNKRIGRIKRFFKWAVSEELVTPLVMQGLNTVQGLLRGRTDARESQRVKPVPEETILQTIPYLLKPVQAMVLLQLHTGMRPGEVVLMRPQDIDQSQEIWIYHPESHKNEWRDQKREIPLGPKAKKILLEFLNRPSGEYLFKPIEAVTEKSRRQYVENQHARKTKCYPSEERAKEKRKALNSIKSKREF